MNNQTVAQFLESVCELGFAGGDTDAREARMTALLTQGVARHGAEAVINVLAASFDAAAQMQLQLARKLAEHKRSAAQ